MLFDPGTGRLLGAQGYGEDGVDKRIDVISTAIRGGLGINDLMDLEPEFAELRAMHPPTLDGSRDKLYHFLSGWTGGPDLYTPRYGNAFLRARHLPFSIGSKARDEWLTCMVLAMRDLGFDEKKQDILLNAFFRTADWMRNKSD